MGHWGTCPLPLELVYVNQFGNGCEHYTFSRPTHSHSRLTPKCKFNYIATLNNMKLVHWPLMGVLLHLVQPGWDWAGLQPAQAPPRCTKCNSTPITASVHRILV